MIRISGEGVVRYTCDLEQQMEEEISKILSILNQKVGEFSQVRDLFPTQVKLLQPAHCCVLVGDDQVFVVLAVHDVGGVSIRQFLDWSGKAMNLPEAILWAERDLAFRNAFGLQFMRSVLDLDDDSKETEIARIAKTYVDDEVKNIERLDRLVKINPVFQGREFLINNQMVFVLSPFEESFNTIYRDHIKPSIEDIENLNCLRADDIYDNRPIIEDIWQHINEARILISELTGRNANVFYETGIAHTVGKEVILITQSMEDVPFDLKHLRCIVYEYTPRGIKNLEENLKSTVLHILSKRAS